MPTVPDAETAAARRQRAGERADRRRAAAERNVGADVVDGDAGARSRRDALPTPAPSRRPRANSIGPRTCSETLAPPLSDRPCAASRRVRKENGTSPAKSSASARAVVSTVPPPLHAEARAVAGIGVEAELAAGEVAGRGDPHGAEAGRSGLRRLGTGPVDRIVDRRARGGAGDLGGAGDRSGSGKARREAVGERGRQRRTAWRRGSAWSRRFRRRPRCRCRG